MKLSIVLILMSVICVGQENVEPGSDQADKRQGFICGIIQELADLNIGKASRGEAFQERIRKIIDKIQSADGLKRLAMCCLALGNSPEDSLNLAVDECISRLSRQTGNDAVEALQEIHQRWGDGGLSLMLKAAMSFQSAEIGKLLKQKSEIALPAQRFEPPAK